MKNTPGGQPTKKVPFEEGYRLVARREPQKHVNDFRHRCERCGKAIDPPPQVKLDLVPHVFIGGLSVCVICSEIMKRERCRPKTIDVEYVQKLRGHFGLRATHKRAD